MKNLASLLVIKLAATNIPNMHIINVLVNGGPSSSTVIIEFPISSTLSGKKTPTMKRVTIAIFV